MYVQMYHQVILVKINLHLAAIVTLEKVTSIISANVTPVHKVDNRELVENYRSISLLAISAKCLERIVHNAIYSHVSTYLSEWQHPRGGGGGYSGILVTGMCE